MSQGPRECRWRARPSRCPGQGPGGQAWRRRRGQALFPAPWPGMRRPPAALTRVCPVAWGLGEQRRPGRESLGTVVPRTPRPEWPVQAPRRPRPGRWRPHPRSDSPSQLCLLPAVTAPCPPGALGNLALTWSSGLCGRGPAGRLGGSTRRVCRVWEPCKPELLVSEDEEGPATRSGRGSRSQRGRVPPLRGVVPPLRGSAARREPAPREPGARPRGRLGRVARGLASPRQRREWGAECRGATAAGCRQPGRGQPGRGQPGRHLGTRRHRGPVRKRPSGRKPTSGPLVTAAGRARAVHKQPPEGVRNAMVLAPSCASASSLEEGFPGREPASQCARETPRVYAAIYTLGGFLCSCWFGHLDSDRPVKPSLNVQVSVSTPPPHPPIHAPPRRPPTCPSVQLTHASTCPRLLSGPIRSPAKQVQLP